MEMLKSPIPPCPYCDSDTGECEHVLINYDRSFGEYRSGYLAKDNPEMKIFEAGIINLIKLGVTPDLDELEDDFASIWDCAADSYDKDDETIHLDRDPYLRILMESYLGEVDSFDYPENDSESEEDDDYEIPGYSSAAIIIYAENPPAIIASLNNDILETFKSFK